MAGRTEVDPAAVVRPAVQLLEAVVPGQPPHGARGEREHVDVAAARAGRDERDLAAVGRNIGRRSVAGSAMSSRASPPRGGHGPDVAARREGNLASVGRDARLGVRKLRRGAGRGRRGGPLRARGHARRRTRTERGARGIDAWPQTVQQLGNWRTGELRTEELGWAAQIWVSLAD